MGTLTIAVAESNPGVENETNAHSLYAGARLAAEQVNEAGGINGYFLKIVPYADKNETMGAKQNAQAIVQSGALAVIGHSSSDTTSVAAPIYMNAGIPAINASPDSIKTTQQFPNYFNISYTSEQQGAYLANYTKRSLGIDRATIVYTSDASAGALAKKFENTFRGLGGTIVFMQEINGQSDTTESQINDIVGRIFSVNSGILLIAANDFISSNLVIELKNRGFNNPIIGGDNLSSRGFLEKIQNESAEQVHPGYYTDNMISTRALLPDSASGFTSLFVRDFQLSYPGLPVSNSAARGYDAVLAIVKAIQTSQRSSEITQERANIHAALLQMNDPKTTFKGVTGPIYFDRNRNAVRQTLFGIYQYGHLISAPLQYEPILLPERIPNLAEQLDKGHIITLDGKYAYATNIVYTGIDIIDIREIDQKASTYRVDFYLWFRYKPKEQDRDFKPEDIIFTNAESINSSNMVRSEITADGSVYKTLRISGVFKNQFNYQAYPFDEQDLIIQFRNQNAAAFFIQYVVDRPGMRYIDDNGLLNYLSNNGAFDSLFGWKPIFANADQSLFSTTSTFGDPQNFDNTITTDFSLFDIHIRIKRDALEFIIKSLLPLIITLTLAYITFFLPLGHTERIGVGSTALLTTAFFHLSLSNTLPEIGYTVAMEYFFYAAYLMSAQIVFLETISIRMEANANTIKSKKIKEQYEQKRQTLNLIGRIVYPSILLLVIGIGGLAYAGWIDFNPQAYQRGRRAAQSIPQTEPSASHLTNEPVEAEVGTLTLNLTTWRPEDDAQIRKLIEAFEKENPDITVVHYPIAGTNYDNVLTIQFNNKLGPDLFFIPPFDRKYSTNVMDLSSLPIEEQFAENMRVPWQDENGRYYALPYAGVIQAVYYNKNIFNELQLSQPTTWKEFLETAKILKDAGYTPIANGLKEEEESDMFMTLTPNFIGGREGRALYMSTDANGRCFNDAFAIRAFHSMEEIMPYMSADFTTVSSYTSKERFINQEAAMLFGGSWDLRYFSENVKFDWGVFASPAASSARTTVIFQPDIAIGVNNQISPAHQKAAFRFLEWLMTEKSLNLTNEILPGFYPLSNTRTQTANNIHSAEFQQLAENYPTDLRWAYSELYTTNQVPRAPELIQIGLYGIVSNKLSAQEAADQLQTGMAQWYEPAQVCNK
ncbi:MAG: extracellular solute-binding protein [Anaerolineales bacterium]|nr:extracellular solute-binding protein [Anaerolineales bacterium]